MTVRSNIEIGKQSILTKNASVNIREHDYRLFCIRKGVLITEINNEKFEYKETGIFLINPGESIKASFSNDCVVTLLTLPKKNIVRYSDYETVVFKCNSGVQSGIKFEDLTKIVNRIERLSLDKDANLVLNAQYLVLMNELLGKYVHTYSSSIDKKNEHSRYFKRNIVIKDFIEENYNSDISLSDLSEKLNLSLSYTSRFFNQQFGISFTDYLNGIRIINAADDLIYTDLSIIKIAMLNGFTNVSRFNAVFKEKYSTTPSSYRKDQRRITGSESIDSLPFNIKNNNSMDRLNQQSGLLKNIKSDAEKIDINIDIKSKSERHHTGYRKIMNFGSFSKNSEENELNENLNESSLYGFSYVRMKMDSEMGVEESRNFVFKILDSIISQGLKPYIFLCKELIRESIIKKLLSDLVNTYGVSCVSNWYFEIEYDSSTEAHFNVINTLSQVVNPDNIGLFLSKSLVMGDIISELSDKVPADIGYISTSFYFDDMDITTNVGQYLLILKSRIRSNFPDINIHLSEWGFSQSNTPINDSIYWGAEIIKFVISVLDEFAMFGYSSINDYLSLNQSREVLFGGSGLVSKDLVTKPSGFAFIFMKKMGAEIIFRNENVIVTKKNDYEYVVLAHNSHGLNDYYKRHKDNLTNDDLDLIFDIDSKYRVDLNLINLPLGEYKLKTYVVNEYHGNVLNTWKGLGNISNLRSDEFSYLRSSSSPRLSLKMLNNSSVLTVPFTLNRNSFFMTYIYRIY